MGASVAAKIIKKDGSQPTKIEKQVAQALIDLESTVKDLVHVLSETYIHAAKSVEFQQMGKKKETIVIFLAQRTILGKGSAKLTKGQIRPRSRTLSSVHENILSDIVWPTQVVGKRTRVRVDGSKLLKIHLDPKDAKDVDVKLVAFSSVYKKLTNKTVQFLFPPLRDY